MKNVIVILFAVAMLALAGCGTSEPEPTETPIPPTNTPPPTDTPPPPTDTPTPEIAGNPERGRALFENGGSHEDYKPRYACMNCHTLDGSEDNGPTLQGISMRAGETVSGLTAAEYVRQSIMEPRAYLVDGFSAMGSINSLILSEEEVDDLVAFLLTQ